MAATNETITLTGSTFGARLRELRGLRGMSRIELGRAAELDDRTIANYELGNRKPSPDALLRLGRALNAELVIRPDSSPADMLDTAPEPEPEPDEECPGPGRGDTIRSFQAEGWRHHSEVVIWKDPVSAMQRTKALGLLHKTVRENSSMARQGIPDYLITMRAPGECPREERVTHDPDDYPVSLWQRVASPVWSDIDPNDTLQHRSAREHDDERHICPLQLEVIRRGIRLWTNPGEVVLSPFAGIGSEGFVALQEGRRFVGAELKESYFKQAARNLAGAKAQGGLFGEAP